MDGIFCSRKKLINTANYTNIFTIIKPMHDLQLITNVIIKNTMKYSKAGMELQVTNFKAFLNKESV